MVRNGLWTENASKKKIWKTISKNAFKCLQAILTRTKKNMTNESWDTAVQ